MLRRISKRIGLSLVAALAVANSALAYSVADAVADAMEYSFELKISEEGINISDAQKWKAIAGFLPSVVAKDNHSRTKAKWDQGEALFKDSRNNRQYGITVNQNLFEGGASVARIAQAGNRQDIADNLYKAQLNLLILDTIRAYENLLTARQVVSINKHNEKTLQENLNIAKIRFAEGEVTKTDVLQSEATLATASANLASANRDLKSAEATYFKIVGKQMPKKVSELNISRIQVPKSMEEFFDEALHNNLNLRNSKHDVNVSNHDVTIAYANMLPKVNASAEILRDDMPGDSTSKRNINQYTLSVQIPIFQSSVEYADIKEKRAVRRQQEYRLAANQDNLRETVVGAWENFIASKSVIESSKDAVRAAVQALEGVQEEAKAGTRTTVDILDEQTKVFNAELQLLRAQRDHKIAILTMYDILGSLHKLEW
jgi:outer membrane protein